MQSLARPQRVLEARNITKVLNFDQKESLCYCIGLEAKVALSCTKTFYNRQEIG